MKKILSALVLLTLLLPRVVWATTLSTLAASLSPGQFAQIPEAQMSGFGNGLIMTPQGAGCANFQDTITQFANKAVWNTILNQFMFVGSPHGSCNTWRLVIYDDATNTWSIGPSPSAGNQPQHSYDHNTINPANGTMYWRDFNSLSFRTLPNGAGSWSSIASFSSSNQCCGALEYFPDQNRLIFIDGDNGGRSYNPATNAWTQLWFGFNGGGSPILDVGHHSNWAEYSNLGLLVFGGSGGNYKMNAAGTITTMSSPPFGNFTIGNEGSCCSVAADPVTGHLVVISGSNVWNLNPTTGTWTSTGTTAPSYFGNAAQDLISAPISDYGVIMYVKCNRSSSCQAYLYKHGAGTPDTTPPTAPSALVVTPISFTRLDLSWTASSDAVGVSSYLIERSPAGCGAFAQVGTSATNSFSNTGLTASTTYCYRVRASDAANNLSGYSTPNVSATTTAADTTAPTVPANLTATAISASQVNLSWSASTDAVGVTAYLLERCAGAACVNFSQIISQTGIIYSDTTGLLASTLYRYRVRATDAATNLSSYSSIAQATTPAGSGSDFTARCAAAGVLRCFSFDTDTDFAFGSGGAEGGRGLNYGYLPPSSNGDFTKITRDTATKTSGASSLRLNIPGSGGADVAGAWFANFSADLSQQLQPGQDIWIQVRYRVDSNFLNQNYGGHGFKIMDISGGDLPGCAPGQGSALCPTTCWAGENVFTTEKTSSGHLIIAYSNCTGNNGFNTAYGFTSNFSPQNVNNCLYPSYVAPPCIYMTANEWWTMKIHIRVGTYNSYSSTYQVWVGREGQPTSLIIDCGPAPGRTCLNRQGTAQPGGWWIEKDTASPIVVGKVWLLPYQTDATFTGLQPAQIWYDDLIISRSDIADPGGSITPPVALAAPSVSVTTP